MNQLYYRYIISNDESGFIKRKDKMDMCTEKENEELMEVLITAARAAFLSLKETTKEHFYFYVFVFDEGLHPYI